MDDRIETDFLPADQLTTPAHDPDPNPDQSSWEKAAPKIMSRIKITSRRTKKLSALPNQGGGVSIAP